MTRLWTIALALLAISGCAASFVSQYGVERDQDKFRENRITVTMKGGIIDADYLGIVARPATFNPFVVRSQDNKVLATGMKFTLARAGGDGGLNIRKGSTATFLIDNSETFEIIAVSGDIDHDDAAENSVSMTKYDYATFYIDPEKLKRLAYAESVEIRLQGASGYEQFPRLPNRHIVKNFLPNIRTFYEHEVQAYL